VVLLFSLTFVYQDISYEVDLKYGDRDISENSSVFPRSKDEGAGWRTTIFTIHKPNSFVMVFNKSNKRKSVRQSWTTGHYTVMSCSLPWLGPKPFMIFTKVL